MLLYLKGLVKLQLGFLTIVNKVEFDPIITQCETQQTHLLKFGTSHHYFREQGLSVCKNFKAWKKYNTMFGHGNYSQNLR